MPGIGVYREEQKLYFLVLLLDQDLQVSTSSLVASTHAQYLALGLVSALTILRNGLKVRIIEKEPSIRKPGQRGAGIQIEEQSGGRAPPFQLHTSPEGEKPIGMFEMHQKMEPTSDRPIVNPTVLGQQPHEAILRSVIESDYGVTVEVGTALVSLEQHPDSVTVVLDHHDGEQETAKFDWVIGADGARGVVRKQLGLTFLGETRQKDRATVIGDIFVKSGLEGRFCRSWGTNADRQINLLTFEKHEDRYTFICGGVNLDCQKMSSSREAWLETFYDVTGRRDVVFGDVIWMGTWGANIRMANKFGEGRVFIVGDAGHVHSPTGAQGLNSCVQDAINIAWKLALVHKKLSPPTLLDSYTAERLPVIASMLGWTTELLNSTYKAETANSGLGRPAEMHQLGVNYRGSPIVVDRLGKPSSVDPYRSGLDEGPLRAGDRAPDAPELVEASRADVKRLFDIFKPTYHTVLVFGWEGLDDVRSLVGKYSSDVVKTAVICPADSNTTETKTHQGVDFAFVDKGYAHKHYGIEKSGVVVVRPDGYVGAVVNDLEGLRQYFSKIFV
ncbi:hypothetical protein V5O48_004128 [Marasmius crinis-equi]|uniref:FAD-binding domain-containing protein n=1 Tax=Marasmius crinis-equi TaxID=585013 RepID=A0ABR3FQX8_9AGAR